VLKQFRKNTATIEGLKVKEM